MMQATWEIPRKENYTAWDKKEKTNQCILLDCPIHATLSSPGPRILGRDGGVEFLFSEVREEKSFSLPSLVQKLEAANWTD